MENIEDVNWKEQMVAHKNYVIAFMILFYLVPLCIQDIGVGILILLLITPMLCFIMGMIYALEHREPYYVLIFQLCIYVPSVYVHYNSIALCFGLGYFMASVLGYYVGSNVVLMTNKIAKKLPKG